MMAAKLHGLGFSESEASQMLQLIFASEDVYSAYMDGVGFRTALEWAREGFFAVEAETGEHPLRRFRRETRVSKEMMRVIVPAVRRLLEKKGVRPL